MKKSIIVTGDYDFESTVEIMGFITKVINAFNEQVYKPMNQEIKLCYSMTPNNKMKYTFIWPDKYLEVFDDFCNNLRKEGLVFRKA